MLTFDLFHGIEIPGDKISKKFTFSAAYNPCTGRMFHDTPNFNRLAKAFIFT